MKKQTIILIFLAAIVAISGLFPEAAHAQFIGGGGFESRMNNLTNRLIGVVLPLASVLGLVYAVILALLGDAGAKGRIIMVIGCSIVGLLAPHIIGFFQSAVGA